MRYFALAAALFILAPSGARAEESSWIFRPSYYSHSPVTCERIAQYQPDDPAPLRIDPTYQESGYSHNHSGIRVANSDANLHIVQTWGQGDSIRPYGEWEFPYRAGATPYGPWGNPQGPWTLPFESWQNPFAQGQNNGIGQCPPWSSWSNQPGGKGNGWQSPWGRGSQQSPPPMPPGSQQPWPSQSGWGSGQPHG